jgi:hypothetical protein
MFGQSEVRREQAASTTATVRCISDAGCRAPAVVDTERQEHVKT